MQMHKDQYAEAPIIRAKRPLGFDDRGVDIERFLYQICMLPCMQKLGVNEDTFKGVILHGRGMHGIKSPLSLRRLWNGNERVAGSAYFRGSSPKKPGKINISISGGAHPGNVYEVILHEFIHSIGYDHGREMNLVLAKAAFELWGVNLREFVPSKKFDTRYGVDNELTRWLKENIGVNTPKTNVVAVTKPKPKPKVSKIRVEEDGSEFSILMSRKTYAKMHELVDYLADLEWDEQPDWLLTMTSGERVEVEKLNHRVTLHRDHWGSLYDEYHYRFERTDYEVYVLMKSLKGLVRLIDIGVREAWSRVPAKGR